MPKPSEFRLRINREKTVSVVNVPGSKVGEEIEVEPDMLPIKPLSEGGERTWGVVHLLGYWGEFFSSSRPPLPSSPPIYPACRRRSNSKKDGAGRKDCAREFTAFSTWRAANPHSSCLDRTHNSHSTLLLHLSHLSSTVADYAVAEAFGISQYQVASSAVAAGLSPGATIGAVLLGHFLVGCANAANGYVGCVYGVNFPVMTRSSFGQRGVFIALICRSVAAIVWAGTQTYQGGLCVEVMIRAIWPSFATFPNYLPASANVTSSQLLCFFIFYIIQLPLLWIPMPKLRYLFLVKVIIMPIFGFAMFGWAVGSAKGFGPVFNKETNITTGVPAAVVFFTAMSSAIAPKATIALNIADFTRYARSPRTVVWTNIVSLSILVTLCACLGVVVTSAAEVIYGVKTWNPLQVSVLMHRAPMFFSAFCWCLSVIATNISANTTAVANDLMLAFPKYINIRRGQYLCIIIALATTPWNIQNSATSFTAFLSGYSVFLGPPCGVLLADFWVVRRRRLNLAAMYRLGPGTEQFYWHGFNPRAVAAFVCGVIPTLPGFIRQIGGAKMGIAIEASYIYCCVWPVGVTVAAAVYIVLNMVFPYKSYEDVRSVVEHEAEGDDEKVDQIDLDGEEKKY